MTGTVLVVENEVLTQRLVSAVVEFCGFTPRMTENSRACLDVLNHGLEPVLILVDLEMPTVKGVEFLTALKPFSIDERCPIVVFTANNHENTIMEAIRLGADDVVVKPFKTIDLAHRIKELTYVIEESELQALLHNLHIHEDHLHDAPSLHHRVGPSFNLFPFAVANQRMCVAIPRGMSPQVVARISLKELRSQISIFRSCTSGWRKVWPRSSKMAVRLPKAG